MISLNKDLPLNTVRAGVWTRMPKQDPAVLSVSEWTFDPGVELPAHPHEEGQIGYIVSGKVRLIQGDENEVLEAGSYYYTPPGVTHFTEIIEKTTMIIVGAATGPQAEGHSH